MFTRKYSDFRLCRVRFFGGVFFHRDFELLLSSESSFLLNVAIYIASLDFGTVKPKPSLHKPSIFNLKNLYSNKIRNSKDDALPYFSPPKNLQKPTPISNPSVLFLTRFVWRTTTVVPHPPTFSCTKAASFFKAQWRCQWPPWSSRTGLFGAWIWVPPTKNIYHPFKEGVPTTPMP